MVLFNYATKEITAKVVYYGPGLCGKTTNLEKIYANPKLDNKGKMISMSTETDRTLFFDFMPMELGSINGQKVRVQLYTVPGQVRGHRDRHAGGWRPAGRPWWSRWKAPSSAMRARP